MTDRPLTADDLCWNWARWCWDGGYVGNCYAYEPEEIDFRPIVHEQAEAVDRMHRALPRHEGMILIAEYPQKNVRYGHLNESGRRSAARRWIFQATGVSLTDTDYSLYLGLFLSEVERRLL